MTPVPLASRAITPYGPPIVSARSFVFVGWYFVLGQGPEPASCA
jgi:hypothetical protein